MYSGTSKAVPDEVKFAGKNVEILSTKSSCTYTTPALTDQHVVDSLSKMIPETYVMSSDHATKLMP